jgi:hypothetical protein
MNIRPKIKLMYSHECVVDGETGYGRPGWYYDDPKSGCAITNPFEGVGCDGPVDPVLYYGITTAQADQLCILNGIEVSA